MNSFKELEVWKSARELRKSISNLTKNFPKEERYRLGDQIIRSSRSVAANIAERFGRYHYQENIQFCRQAWGSLNETLEHLICAFDEGFITEEEFKNQKAVFDSCLKLLNGYIGYLKKAVQNK